LLADDLASAYEQTGSFLEVGVAYVQFAVGHRAHFTVMYRPELLRNGDERLDAARRRSGDALYGRVGSVAPDIDAIRAGVAAWALVHGIATLFLDANLPAELGSDPGAITRSLAPLLFQGPG
jgi:hypothetical protein